MPSTHHRNPTVPELLAQVVEAFPPQPLKSATFADASGMWDSYTENKAFGAGSEGRSWDMLGSEFVQFHFNALGYMNPNAFAAVIPAYLAALVKGDTQNQLPVLVLSQLTRKENWLERFDARVARLSERQRVVIARVLEALAQSDRFSHYNAETNAALDSWRDVRGGTR